MSPRWGLWPPSEKAPSPGGPERREGESGQPDLIEAEKDARLIEAVAVRVVQMGMAVPGIFFLESTKPLSFIGSQALVFLEPFVKSFLNLASYDRFTSLMEDRKNIETLIVRIEDLDEKARAEEKERKKLQKQEAQERKKLGLSGKSDPILGAGTGSQQGSGAVVGVGERIRIFWNWFLGRGRDPRA